ncbi:DUF389 domain-containing protein [Porphyromonas cangingivalis]|uniref:Uncharacterized hydrophobic domain-containing protein n=1 Tax=Porphyromonas cangingivalis TaxID=36874 RepID=A0A1T4JQI6_PORCN|nr:DUF389 domain-containing protein [Porphyromonas cangingivalis]SJZ32413.1 uncharacterized hydrophobic domain-containing protein [Porphyromonas cangingivalis]VEJ04619.1 uncharacterized hydrophobic domain [Porphyromonas cangingivalis]
MNNTPNPPVDQNNSEPRQNLWEFLISYFDVKGEKENELLTIEAMKSDVDFRGTKAWILICAIFIASLGLNTNSTAVIIGAMLISPLMGPIIGLGLGLGIVDFRLVRKALRNFAIATGIALLTSTLYFLISPISTAQSELLARTQPTLYDVLIALVGGVAGVLAGATKSKGNVIPGVAIATALMPPLCTAGYGIATGQPNFFFGAFYLYMINCVFIGLATYMMIKLLKYRKVSYMNPIRAKRLSYLVLTIVTCTAVPSVFLGYKLIQANIFEEQKMRFIRSELAFQDTQVLKHHVFQRGDSSIIEVSMIGKELTPDMVQYLQAKLPDYGLKNTALVVRQGFGSMNLDNFRSDIMQDITKSSSDYIKYQQLVIDSLRTQINDNKQLSVRALTVSADMKTLFPEIVRADFSNSYSISLNSLGLDTVLTVTLVSEKALTTDSKERLRRWLSDSLPGAFIQFHTLDEN